MRGGLLSIALGLAASLAADGQAFRTKNKEQIFLTPKDALATKLGRVKLSDEEANSFMWNFSHDTMPSDEKIRRNIRQSEETPYWTRRSVWADATMPERMAEFGAGRYSALAVDDPTPFDRWMASQLPERDYATKADDLAILAAVYRHFFGYRGMGMGADAHNENVLLRRKDVYFLGLGPHLVDAPASLLAALQADPGIVRDGIVLRPLSKVLEVTGEAIRDRDTGAYGLAFRVDDVGPPKDGVVRVMATFNEREGFWFTRELTLRPGRNGLEVAEDADSALK